MKRTIKNIIIYLLGISLASFILAGCSASWHMRQAIKKDPGIIQNDTITVTDTVWQVVEEVDTIVQLQKEYDTIKYIQDSVIIELVKLPGDSVYVAADCPDCPEVTTTNTVTKTISVKPTIWERLKDAFILVGIFALVFLGVRIVKQFI